MILIVSLQPKYQWWVTLLRGVHINYSFSQNTNFTVKIMEQTCKKLSVISPINNPKLLNLIFTTVEIVQLRFSGTALIFNISHHSLSPFRFTGCANDNRGKITVSRCVKGAQTHPHSLYSVIALMPLSWFGSVCTELRLCLCWSVSEFNYTVYSILQSERDQMCFFSFIHIYLNHMNCFCTTCVYLKCHLTHWHRWPSPVISDSSSTLAVPVEGSYTVERKKHVYIL